MDLTVIGCDYENWINLDQNRPGFLNTLVKLQGLTHDEEYVHRFSYHNILNREVCFSDCK